MEYNSEEEIETRRSKRPREESEESDSPPQKKPVFEALWERDPTFSRWKNIGADIEEYFENLLRIYMTRKEIPDHIKYVQEIFDYLFKYAFESYASEIENLKIRVLAVDPSFVNLGAEKRLYLFRLRVFFLRNGAYSVKPFSEVLNKAEPAYSSGTFPHYHRNRSEYEIWYEDKKMVSEELRDVNNNVIALLTNINCLALYESNTFKNIIELSFHTDLDFEGNPFDTNLSEPEKKALLMINFWLNNPCRLFEIDGRLYVQAMSHSWVIVRLYFNPELLYSQNITSAQILRFPTNIYMGQNINTIDIRLNEMNRIEKAINCQIGIDTGYAEIRIVNDLLIHTLATHKTIISRSNNEIKSIKFVGAIKIEDGVWLGIGKCDAFFDVLNLSHIRRDYKTINRLSEMERRQRIENMKSFHLFDVFEKEILSRRDKNIIVEYDKEHWGSYLKMRAVLSFFYLVRKEDDASEIFLSPFFLPINTESDYTFVCNEPTGITIDTDLSDQFIVTYSSGNYQSFEINFGIFDILRHCKDTLNTENFVFGLNIQDTHIIHFSENKKLIPFPYIFAHPKNIINGHFTHKKVKDAIISIGKDYKVTLLNKKTLLPISDELFTLEDLFKTCFK